MAPRNPRLQKFKTIINKMNTIQENKTQNSNIGQLKSSPIPEKDPVYSIDKPASTDHLFANSSHACSPQVTTTASYNSKHPSYNMHAPAPTDYLFACTAQEYQNISCSENSNDAIATSMYSLRYRRVSCSSGSDDQSEKDFSPASDDDQEFVPPSDEEISDSEPDSFQKQSFIKKRPLLRARSVSSKSDSSSSSSSSDSSSSSSSSSDSSSSDSSGTESDVSDETPPTKKKRIDAQNTQNESLSSSSLVIQLPVLCPYSSTSEEEDELEVPVSSFTHPEFTSDIIEENNITENHLPNCTTHDDQGEALSENRTASEHLSSLHADAINEICGQTGSTVVPPETNNPLSLAAIARNSLNDGLSHRVLAESTVNFGLNDSDGDAPKTRRKRKRGSKKEIAQTRRNMGLEYTTFKNKNVVPERKIGDPCGDKCILKCPEKITEQDRTEIFKSYWNMGSLALQREFIARHMTEVRPKYQYKKVDSNRRNKHAFYLTVNNEKIRVCKTYFKSTLDINDRPIRTVISKLNVSGIIEPDLRGKHENHGTKISDDLLDEVKRHINSIPRIESHFLRQRTDREYVDREYIDGGKTVTDLHRDYVNDCIMKGLDYVKLHTYRNLFNNEFNISFFKPKKDQCEDCVAYENSTVREKEKSEESYRTHLKEKNLARDEKIKDKSFINETHIVACYDLQAVLPVPKGDVSTFYYKSKLNCLNFTICELKKDNTECYFWTEVEGERGANEIGTCVFKFIEKKSRSTSNDINITFYSDNCCGQQKNQFVFSMYIYALKHFPNILSITHKFLIKGHTQNENDSVHSTIERQIKKMLKSGPIFVPDQYIHAIKEAKKNGQKYCINEMSHSEFYNIKKLTEYKLNKNTEGEIVKTGDIKVLHVEKMPETPNKVKVTYKTSYDQERFKEVKLQRTTARPQLLKLYSSRLVLSERKKKDLKELLQKHVIPSYYGSSYYNHIL